MGALPAVKWMGAAAIAASMMGPATAATQTVTYTTLGAAATVPVQLGAGDNLFIDVFSTGTGALTQATTFTLSDSVDVTGLAGWIIDTDAGHGPRLVGVNIDILDASSTVLFSDTFTGVLGGFAHSSFLDSLGPGTYTILATGTAVRDASLDISLSFAQPIPEPGTWGMLLGGLGILAVVARRR